VTVVLMHVIGALDVERADHMHEHNGHEHHHH